ncbi:MAG: alcohol dehydrogenase [Calditrichaeota bacterium]|nr:MAG: alcohol dehydrogenase [Calditrichota bacterium]MBL1206170.1 alcohol dehydrogenase [Calditrichota bacterium]NOG45995.1 zinc-binding dehydrogenase [Calditrichota bacterium]
MRVVRIHKHGGVDNLKIDNLETPKPAPNEVLVKIKYAALNHLDIFVREGFPGIPLPLVLGSDGAGEIVEVGSEVENYTTGDEIINVPFRIPLDDPLVKRNQENLSSKYTIPGEHSNGCQAEYVSIPQEFILHKPKNISWEEAAAFPLASLTAYHMLIAKVNLQKGQWVLIYGASSGVGSAAIQIAKAISANVITTVGSKEKAEMAKKLGADYTINYNEEPIGKTAKEISGGIDIVFEHTGEKTWRDSLRCLKIGGKVVTCGATTGPFVNIDLRALFIKQQQIIGSTMGTMQDMKKVCELVAQKKLKPVVGKIFDFEDIKLAHEWLESGKQFGKVLLRF